MLHYCALARALDTALQFFFFFSSRRRHTRLQGDWSSDVCSSDLASVQVQGIAFAIGVPPHIYAFHCYTRNSIPLDRKSTRLNSSHLVISYAVFCLKKKKKSILQLEFSIHWLNVAM